MILILRLHQQVLGVAHGQDSQQQREGDIGSHRNGTLSNTACSCLTCHAGIILINIGAFILYFKELI